MSSERALAAVVVDLVQDFFKEGRARITLSHLTRHGLISSLLERVDAFSTKFHGEIIPGWHRNKSYSPFRLLLPQKSRK
ncbi:hypothetical protein AB1N83_008020 [Pleurotus pulmonarius]